MQISRFTSSKPSKFAFASDEKSIRQPTTSFARCYLNLLFLWNMPYWFLSLLPSRLRTRSCSFLSRQKGTKERPEGAEEGASLDFSPLWTPPRLFHFLRERAAAAVRLVGTSLALFFVWKIQNLHLFAQKEAAAQVHTHFPAFSRPLHFAAAVLRNRTVNTAS